ncbi:hypothetical protein ACFRJ7_28830 [Streptomyces sp. NPDC056747]|uniref:hypothetical protein n=1 Tax=Streptomyces sp. NPDC056747 TaxID=3345935 RepID=UPI0036922E1C
MSGPPSSPVRVVRRPASSARPAFGWTAAAVAVAAKTETAAPVATVPSPAHGRRTRYELADERLGRALDDLRTAVVAVETDRTCPDAETKGCC